MAPQAIPLGDVATVESSIAPGLLTSGTVDLFKRPKVKNPNGTVSTVRSMSFNEDGREILIPTVSDEGTILSDDEAIARYRKTGKHLGIFTDPVSATVYAQRLHEDYAAGKYDTPSTGGRLSLADVVAVESGPSEVETRSRFAQAVDVLSAPTAPARWLQEKAHRLADLIDRPRVKRSQVESVIQKALSQAIPFGMGAWMPTASEATRAGATAGVVQGVGDVVAGLGSPLGVAAMASGPLGVGAKAVGALRTARILRAVEAATGGVFAARGVEETVEAPTVAGKALGVAQAAGGALGARAGVKGMQGARRPGPRARPRALLTTGTTFTVDKGGVAAPAGVERPMPAAAALQRRVAGSQPLPGWRGVRSTSAAEPARRALPPGPDFLVDETGQAVPLRGERYSPEGEVVPTRGMIPPRRAIPLNDVSRVESVPAPVLAYEAEVSPAKPGGASRLRMIPAQYASEAGAAPTLSTGEAHALRWMKAELESIPFTKHTFSETTGKGGALEIAPGSAGAPIYQAIVGGMTKQSRPQVIEAINKLLEGHPTPLGVLAQGVARDLAAGDRTLVKQMSLPPEAGGDLTGTRWAARATKTVPKSTAVGPDDEAVYAAFARAVEEMANEPLSGRLVGEEGRISPLLQARVATGGLGAAYGAATGTTPEDRAKRALAFGAAGALAPSLFTGGKGGKGAAVAGRVGPGARGPEPVLQGARGVRLPRGLQQPLPPPLRQIETFPKELRQDLTQLVAENGGFQEARGGGRVPWSWTDLKALQTPVNLARPGKRVGLLPEEIGAWKNALATLQSRALRLAEQVKSGAVPSGDHLEAIQLQLLQTNAQSVAAAAGLFGRTTEAGRALNYAKQLARIVETTDIKFVREALKQARRQGDVPEALAEQLMGLTGDPIGQLRFLRSQQRMTPGQLTRGYFYQNILSGLASLRNVTSNTIKSTWEHLIARPLVTVPLDVVESALRARPREVFIGETPAWTLGAMVGIPKGLRNAVFQMRYGFSREATYSGAFDTLAPELPGGLATNFFTRFLNAQDELNVEVLREANEWGRAFAKAKKHTPALSAGAFAKTEAAKVRAATQESPTLREFFTRVTEYKLDAQATDKAGALADALRTIYREQPGRFPRWLIQGKRQFPALDFVMAFVKVPANQLRQAFEQAPTGALMQATRQAGREGIEARGRAIAGSAGLALLAYHVAVGDITVTGMGYRDPGRRLRDLQSGWKPNSLRLRLPATLAKTLGAEVAKDGYYYVSWMGLPMAPVLAMVANGYEAWRNSGRTPQDAWKIAAKTVAGAAASVLDQSFYGTILDMNGSLIDPDRYVEDFVQQYAQSMGVPLSQLMRALTRVTDPVVRRPGGPLEAVKAIVPGLSTSVPARLDPFGQEIRRKGGVFQRGFAVAPLSIQPSESDPIVNELTRLGVGLPMPDTDITVQGQRVVLSRDEKNAMTKQIGQERKRRLELALRQPGYSRLPDQVKTVVLRRVMASATEDVHLGWRATRGARR